MIPPLRLIRLPKAGDATAGEAALVSVETGSQEGWWLVRVARGASFERLTGGAAYGPYPADQLPDRIETVLRGLQTEGFVQAAGADLIAALTSDRPSVRALAALRLGWRGERQAVPALLAAAEGASGEICAIVDALGWIGDPAAFDLARSQARRKHLSRRRSGVEALRNLGDDEGLEEARRAGEARLPAALRDALHGLDESATTGAPVKSLLQAVEALDPRRHGVVADLLYERATPVARAAARRLLSRPARLREPHMWRYAKSVLKRAMLRHDTGTFALLAHAVERASIGYLGERATLKSGRDGKQRELLVFGRKTQRWIRGVTWRYLRDLACYRGERYVAAASAVLARYRAEDAGEAKGRFGSYADAFLLNRILFANRRSLEVNWRTLRHRVASDGTAPVTAPEAARDEAFPRLWDAFPDAFLRLLGSARLVEVQDFALDGLRRHPEVLARAPIAALVRGLRSARREATELVLGELTRRLEAEEREGDPVPLLQAVLADGHEALRELSLAWLARTVGRWATDAGRLSAFLAAADARLRLEVAKLAAPKVEAASASFRNALAERILTQLRAGEPEEGAHAPLAQLALGALLGPLSARLGLDDLLRLIAEGSHAARQIAAALLAENPEAYERLGLEGVVALGEHEVAAVRTAAHTLLRRVGKPIEDAPAPLFALVESEWNDTRDFAAGWLRSIPAEVLGLDGLIGLCDSTRAEVQALGRDLVEGHFDHLDGQTVLLRLAEHPARRIRLYAYELIRGHLGSDLDSLTRIAGFFRTCLFDMRPDRRLKYGVIDFLTERGLMESEQAAWVAALLSEVVRTATASDFQRISQALARLQVSYPEVSAELQMVSAEDRG